MGFFATSGILNERGFFGEGFDPDALDYINRVETADGERLEPRVRTAINQFVLGCKADGIWALLVTSCIMAGARTVAGAITPLVGNAPTNINFTADDYSRTLGLRGNNTNKYLATGYNNNDTTNFPQNNTHISCFVSASQTNANGVLVGGTNTIGGRLSIHYTTSNNILCRNRASLQSTVSLAPKGFQGHSRDNSSSFKRRFTTIAGISDATVTSTSSAPASDLLGVFATGSGNQLSSARISFYSIGKSLSIPSLDTRVTTLINAIASALA